MLKNEAQADIPSSEPLVRSYKEVEQLLDLNKEDVKSEPVLPPGQCQLRFPLHFHHYTQVIEYVCPFLHSQQLATQIFA